METFGSNKFPIGRLSTLSGVNIETIRYYERIGLLPQPQRTASGRRVFGREDLRALMFIRRSRELGFSLDHIRELLRLTEANASCREVRDLTLPRLADIRLRMRDLRKMEQALTAMLERCPGDERTDCPILDALDIERSPSDAAVHSAAPRA